MQSRVWIVAALLGAAIGASGAASGTTSDTLSLRFKNEAGQWVTLNQPGVLYLVDFWTIGCRPCLVEMPELISLEDEFNDDPRVQFVSVATETGSAIRAREQLRSRGLHPKRLFADADDWFNRLQLNAWPTKLLIRDGKILRFVSGALPSGNDARWREEIRAFLKVR